MKTNFPSTQNFVCSFHFQKTPLFSRYVPRADIYVRDDLYHSPINNYSTLINAHRVACGIALCC